jgi:hypothetical protein
LPLVAVVTVSHDALLDAVHAQPEAVDSVVLPDAPAAETDADVVPSAYAHPEAWLSVNVAPPIVSVPLRAGPVFAAYEYESVPLPDAPAPVVSHVALLAPFHAHPVCVVMPTEPAPEADAALADAGDSDHVHAGDVPEDFDARKFATVSAFWLCTRAVSAVAALPVGLAGLP